MRNATINIKILFFNKYCVLGINFIQEQNLDPILLIFGDFKINILQQYLFCFDPKLEQKKFLVQ